MKNTVFIHTNEKQLLGGLVSSYSLRSRSKSPEEFEIQFIHLEEFPQLAERHGTTYLRGGKRVVWDRNDLQSFTLLRFLPPQLMNYRGRGIVIDPDIFALGDINDLFTRDFNGASVACRHVDPGEGKPKYYATSMMLLDCEQLSHWRWDELIEAIFSGSADYKSWINLDVEPSAKIFPLEEEWNHFDILTAETKLLHNTGRITQPWKTGLPIDFVNEKKGGVVQQELYRKHPDENQERFFFGLVRECLDNKVFDEAFLREEMKRNHLRHDAFEVLDALR